MMNSFDPGCPSTDRGKRLAAVEIGAAPAEKTRQMLADHRIGGKGKAEFLEPDPA